MNKTFPKYTFLLPAYKSSFLADALQSIKNQSFENFKVIVSDDNSPENIKEIYNEIVQDDERFSYRKNDVNMGGNSLVSHWNLLVDLCDTDYFILASDDDIYKPNFLEEADILLNKYPSVGMVRGRCERINEKDELLAKDQPADEFEDQISFLYAMYYLRRIKCIGNYVFQTILFKHNGRFVDFPLAWGSDDATIMNMSKNGVCITPSVTFQFRLSGQNISTKNDVEVQRKKVRARMKNLDEFDNFCLSLKIDDNLLLENRKKEFLSFFNAEWSKNILDGSYCLNFSEMKDCFSFLRMRNFIDGKLATIHYFWTWWKARHLRR